MTQGYNRDSSRSPLYELCISKCSMYNSINSGSSKFNVSPKSGWSFGGSMMKAVYVNEHVGKRRCVGKEISSVDGLKR